MARQAVQPQIRAFLRQTGIKIGRDTGHVPRAQAFHPGLFQHVIDFTRLAHGGADTFMQPFVMVAQAQGGGIRGAAHAGHLRRRHLACGMGQADMRAGNGHPRRHGTVEE